MKSKNHTNCRCNCNDSTDKTIFGVPPRSGKSLSTSYRGYMNTYGHYEIEEARKSIEKAVKNALGEAIEDKGEKMTGLRIKKTDEMSIDEFKENTKAYNTIKLIINKEKYDKVEKEYGAEPFETGYSDDGYEIILKDEIIEFKEKAITIDLTVFKNKCIPYYFIDKVIGTYYIKTEQ